MEIVDKDLFSEDTPLVFTDGTRVYEELKREYKTHDKGYFIYGPSGVGKTYFVNNQSEKIGLMGICFGHVLMLFLMMIGGTGLEKR